MPINRDSNVYTLGYLAVVVVVVAVVLSLMSSSLKPLKLENIENDTRKKILKSVIHFDSDDQAKATLLKSFVTQEYDSKVTEYVVDFEGNAEEKEAFAINFKKETRELEEDRELPLFIYEDGSDKYYIIPLIGLGLWNDISGYLAIESDFETLRGAAFDHVGETPGLGAEIAKNKFGAQFRGKKMYEIQDEDFVFSMNVLKGMGNKLDDNSVDGVSGATITCDGVEDMLVKCVAYYEPYFEKEKE